MLQEMLQSAKIVDNYKEFPHGERVRIPSSAVERVPEGALFRFL